MSDGIYPTATGGLARMRRELTPESRGGFQDFQPESVRRGRIAGETKQLIAVAVAHVTQCPYCIKGHTKAALRHSASREELMEAIRVAAEMRVGAAYAHSVLAIDEMESEHASRRDQAEK